MTPKPRALLLADPIEAADVFGPAERAALSELVEWSLPDMPGLEAVLRLSHNDSPEVIFSSWGVPVMDAVLLERLPRLRVIFHAAGSIKCFATDALWARGIRVTCAASLNAIPVAEYCLAQVIWALKRGWNFVDDVRATRRFNKHDPYLRGAYGSTVGLLSLGHAGRLLAQRLQILDVRIIAHDPHLKPETAATMNVELVDLQTLFERSDVISCHTPLLPETRGLLRRQHFEAMRPGATFINTARGAVVDEHALISVLRARRDLTAVLDVTDPEPPAADSPLFQLPNVVLTPHIAGSLGPECRRLGCMMIEEFKRFQRDEPLLGEQHPDDLSISA